MGGPRQRFFTLLGPSLFQVHGSSMGASVYTPLNLKLVHFGHIGGVKGTKMIHRGGAEHRYQRQGGGPRQRNDTQGGSKAQKAQTGGVEGTDSTKGVVQGTEINWWGGPGQRNHMGGVTAIAARGCPGYRPDTQGGGPQHRYHRPWNFSAETRICRKQATSSHIDVLAVQAS